MRVRRRLQDAMRSPTRAIALGARAYSLWREGRLGEVLGRAAARGFTDAEYDTWTCAERFHERFPAAGPRFLVLLDGLDPATVPHLRVDVLGPGCAAVLRRVDAGRWQAAGGEPAPGPQALGAWLDAFGAEWLVWIATAAAVEPDALARFAAAIGQCPQARLVYCDDDRQRRDGSCVAPRFKPAWDTEQILAANYVGDVLALHRSLVGLIDEGSAPAPERLWRLLLHARVAVDDGAVIHVPRVLVHRLEPEAAPAPAPRDAIAAALQASGDAAVVGISDGRVRIEFSPMPDDDFASIVIPTRDRADLLGRCIDSLRACTASPRYELVIVDNGSTDPAACALLASLERVVPAPGPFNFAALCNAGVQAARGRVVVLLNNDTVVTAGWLAELVALAIRPRVGAVGPLLVYENGTAQSAGVFIGVNRTSSNVLAGCAPDSPIAREWCLRRRRVSAVMGACLAIERAKFLAAGGLDEAFAVSHNELDLCLRLERNGYVNLFTPHARVIHVEGATRGYELTRAERARLEREEQAFRARWRDRVGGHDPAHNPNLARRGDPFALAPPGEVRYARAGWPGRVAGGAASRG